MLSAERTDEKASALIRAAEYVRMSTEHQQYSTENQSDAIREYATNHGYQIVKTYADHGKSGLRVAGRAGLQALIRDVQNGANDFSAVIVYDVSRWGRFLDPDEAAYYQFICKQGGSPVKYCIGDIENDESVSSNILKAYHRGTAAEETRIKSIKVFAGQSRLIRLGYRQGGAAGFGLRRKLIDMQGNDKCLLASGEHKSIQTDRVVLVPGPVAETEVVREIYRLFIDEERSECEITSILNGRGIPTDLGRPWTRGTVNQVLTNEKYVGNNVWNRHSFKLKQEHVANPPEEWIRADAAFEPVIDIARFLAARAIISERSRRFTDDELLNHLKDLIAKHGYLSGIIIDEAEGGPLSSVYRSRFGSLLRAYTLVGYTPDRDYRFLSINRRLREIYPAFLNDVTEGIVDAGGTVERNKETDLLRINDEFTASIIIARHEITARGSSRWNLRLETGLTPDLTLAARMDKANEAPLDYYLLPRIDVCLLRLRLAEHNGIWLDAYRFESLDPFYKITSRVSVLEVAA